MFKLKKSVYSLPQSGRNWYIKLKNTLIEIGFKPLISENCIFIFSHKYIFVAIAIYHETLSRLKKEFEIKDTTNSGKFRNITIKTFESGLGMSQAEYILKCC